MIYRRRHHAECDVRRIEGVMTERRSRVVGGGCPVHERDGTEGRFTNRTARHREAG